jgi:prepilin-type N-terminal cleavage/methylation domain-containing protein
MITAPALLKADRCLKHRPLKTLGKNQAFSLVEMLVTIAVVTLLATLGAGAVQSVTGVANKAREVQAARQLVAALQSSAAENNGTYLPGMDYRAGKASTPVYKPDGTLLSGRAAQRYPYRMAPYLGNRFEGTVLVNGNEQEIREAQIRTGMHYEYLVSAYPALGMNIFCVGGVVSDVGQITYNTDCISRSATARGNILAFASGGHGAGETKIHGFSYVSPPTTQRDSPICEKWQSASEWSVESDPKSFGWVDFRYGGKAVCAFLDGTVRMCDVKELSDMRLWSPSAADADNPAYELSEN